jgi:TfoX/Sxy family transcriptional regulator of competence genes
MAFDEDLAYRIREAVADVRGVTEKRMFGGLAFLVNGNMALSASGQGGMLLHVDPAQGESLLNEPCAKPFEMRGRAMSGWLRVDTAMIPDDEAFRRWVNHGVTYAKSLPAKKR